MPPLRRIRQQRNILRVMLVAPLAVAGALVAAALLIVFPEVLVVATGRLFGSRRD